MIYITGDTHGDYERFLPKKRECLSFQLTKNDYVIVCGDFGLIWSERELEITAYWCDFFRKLPFTTLFVTGNHENYDMLNAYPITT